MIPSAIAGPVLALRDLGQDGAGEGLGLGVDVAADEDHGADLREGRAEGGDQRPDHADPRLAQRQRRDLRARGAERPRLVEQRRPARRWTAVAVKAATSGRARIAWARMIPLTV